MSSQDHNFFFIRQFMHIDRWIITNQIEFFIQSTKQGENNTQTAQNRYKELIRNRKQKCLCDSLDYLCGLFWNDVDYFYSGSLEIEFSSLAILVRIGGYDLSMNSPSNLCSMSVTYIIDLLLPSIFKINFYDYIIGRVPKANENIKYCHYAYELWAVDRKIRNS